MSSKPLLCAFSANDSMVLSSTVVKSNAMRSKITLPSINLEKIEDVVDDRHQQVTAFGGGLGEFKLFGVEIGIEQKFVDPDDAVERRANFAADVGHELRLDAHAFQRRVARAIQLFLGVLALGDVHETPS